MIKIDNTWDKIDNDLYRRLSPTQPLPDKWEFYQFMKPSILRLVEVQVPTMSNRKELERIALGNKWVTRRNKLDEYLNKNPDAIKNIINVWGVENMDLHSYFPIYLKSPKGEMCYERDMLTTDPGFRKGMSVIAGIDDEAIHLKHFDNVVYNASKVGYTRVTEKSAIRDVKINTVIS